MVEKVKKAAGNKISHVFDTIAGKEPQRAALAVLAEDKPGKITTVLPFEIEDFREGVQVASPSPTSFLK